MILRQSGVARVERLVVAGKFMVFRVEVVVTRLKATVLFLFHIQVSLGFLMELLLTAELLVECMVPGS